MGRPCWIIKFVLLWFNLCPSSHIFFMDSTPQCIAKEKGKKNNKFILTSSHLGYNNVNYTEIINL